jgi:hypothetical protein
MVKVILFLMMFIVSSSTAQVIHDEVKTIQTRFEPPNNLTIINVKRFFNEYLKNEDEFSIKYPQTLDKGIMNNLKQKNYHPISSIEATSNYYYCGSKYYKNSVRYHFILEKVLFQSGNGLTIIYAIRTDTNSHVYFFKCASNIGAYKRSVKIKKCKITIKDRLTICFRKQLSFSSKHCISKKTFKLNSKKGIITN